MNALQAKPAASRCDRSAPVHATRPFTRVLNIFCDEIKPAMKRHKVDRSVLDAIVRQLEGFHRSSVALTIEELASRAGVSNSSVSGALRRLEAANLIIRRRKLLTTRSRFIWELSLRQDYRVTEPAPAPQPLRRERPSNAAKLAANDDATPPPDSAPIPELVPPPPAPHPVESEALGEARPCNRQKVRPAKNSEKKLPELTPEQQRLIESLRTAQIDYWMARKLVRAHPPAVIEQALANLRHRVGTVRNPAAWLVREIERGGYGAPPTAQEEQREAERTNRLEAQRRAEELEREKNDTAVTQLLSRFAALPTERQAELEREVRSALRRVSPRLADAPWDLENPGPVRSQLLALLGEDSS